MNRSFDSLVRRAVSALLLLFVAALPLGVPAAEPFEINVIVPLTGPGAFLGKNEAETLNVVERHVNASGGVRGRPIKFVIQDDASTPGVSVQLTNALLAKKVPIILGGTLLGSCLAMAPLVANGPVLYCLSPGIDPQPGSNIFSTFLLTIDLLRPAIKYFSAKGYRRIALLNSTDATGQDADKAIDTIVKNNEFPGVTIVSSEHFNLSDINVTAQVSRIKSSNAQAVISWVTGTGFGTVLHGVNDVGLDIPIVTSTGNLIYGQMKAYSSFTPPNVYFSGDPAVVSEVQADKGVAAAVTTFADLLKSIGARPDQGHALSYDAAMLIINAYRKLGFDATPEQLRAELASTQNYPGIFGRFDFKTAPQRGLTRDTIIVVRWDPVKDTWTSVSKPGGAPL